MKLSNKSPINKKEISIQKNWIDIKREIGKDKDQLSPNIYIDNTFSKVKKEIKGLNTFLTEFQIIKYETVIYNKLYFIIYIY